MLVRSCFLITLIKCLKGHKSLGSLCSVVKTLIVSGAGQTNRQTKGQGHLLSCCGQLKRFHLWQISCHMCPPASWTEHMTSLHMIYCFFFHLPNSGNLVLFFGRQKQCCCEYDRKNSDDGCNDNYVGNFDKNWWKKGLKNIQLPPKGIYPRHQSEPTRKLVCEPD